MPVAELELKAEGLQFTESVPYLIARDILRAGDAEEAQIESIMQSWLLPGTPRQLRAEQVKQPRSLRPSWPWHKRPEVYRLTPFVTVMLATTAFAFPRLVSGSGHRGVTMATPIHHFDRAPEPAAIDDREHLEPIPTLISNAEVEDLKALLAIPYMGDRHR